MWNEQTEKQVLSMRESGMTYEAIGKELGTTATSVKHKVRRLQQGKNMDRYKHSEEKQRQAKMFIRGIGNSILETHCGFGGMTEFYNNFGNVESYDIDKDRVLFVDSLGMEGVTAIKGDSEHEIYRLLANKCVYDVVDIDPYGMPSRYFPAVFGLINNGLLFVTLPMIGVAQINKITIRHLEAFWGVSLDDKDRYTEKVFSRMQDYAFMHKREIELLDCTKIDRIYRLCIKVEKKSCCDIVGLVVNR
jgi:hypothetical protein